MRGLCSKGPGSPGIATAVRRAILAAAAFMGTTVCYALTLAVLVACSAAVAILGESSPAAVGIIYAMSAFSIVQASTILVAQRNGEQEARRRDEAMHAKLDGLIIGVDKADDRLVGIEREVVEEVDG